MEINDEAMLIIRAWEDTEPGALVKYLNNCSDPDCIMRKYSRGTLDRYAGRSTGAFTWSRSPEGKNYWTITTRDVSTRRDALLRERFHDQ